MKTQTSHLLRLLVLSLVAGAVAAGGVLRASPDEPPAPVAARFLPIPKTPWPGFSDMLIEPGGTIWVMANNKVFYWAGTAFREPISGSMQSGYYLAGLYGGPDRGAYATQKGRGEHEAILYRLSDGAANMVTSLYCEVSYEYPGLYVSRAGGDIQLGASIPCTFDKQRVGSHGGQPGITRHQHLRSRRSRILLLRQPAVPCR